MSAQREVDPSTGNKKIGRMLRYIVPVVVAIVAVVTAMLFRYEPMQREDLLWVRLWDRWSQRVCLTPRPETTAVTGIACTESEVAGLRQQMLAEAAARVEQERAGREASARAHQEDLEKQKADAERERKAFMAKKEKAEENRETLSKYLHTDQRLLANLGPSRWEINQMRDEGHTEEYISKHVMPFREKLIAAAAPKDAVDWYFGGDPFLKAGPPPSTGE
jgi:hypothetical protein